MSGKDVLGVIINVESPLTVYARLSTHVNVNVGLLVEVVDRDFKTRLLGRITNIVHKNIIQDDRLLQRVDYDSIKLLEEYGIDIEYLTATTIAKISIVGQLSGSRVEVPRRPPRLYSIVKIPDRETLDSIVNPGEDCVKIRVGKLRDFPDVEVHLNADKLVTHHCAILAATGSGKSWLAGVIIEELTLTADMSIIVFDPHSEYSTMQLPATKIGIDLDETEIKLAEKICEQVKIYVPARVDTSAIDNYFRKRFGVERRYERVGIFPTMLPLSILLKLVDHYYGLSETQRRVLEEAWSSIASFTDEYMSVQELLQEIERVGRQVLPRGFAGESSLTSLLSKLRLLFENRLFFITRLGEYFQGKPIRLLNVEELVTTSGIKIFDLSGLDLIDQQAFIAVVLDQVLKLATRRKSKPTIIVLEEAHNFAPSRGDSLCLSTILRVAREGRKFGIGLLVISQRPTRLHPDLLSQCMTHIFKRMINPHDLKYVREVVEFLQVEDLWELKLLNEDEALITGLAVKLPLLVKVRKRYTAHGGLTPKLRAEV